MALTESQKWILDNKVLSFLKDHVGVSFYASEIKDSVDEEANYTVSAIVGSIKRITRRNSVAIIDNGSGKNCYIFKDNCISIKFNQGTFIKDKNKLYIGGVDKNECYYDFITKKFIIKDNAEPIFSGKYTDAFMALPNYPEWMFNYTDSIFVITHIYNKYDVETIERMPANLYEFLQKKFNGVLTSRNFNEFINITKYKKYYKLVNKLEGSPQFTTAALDKFLEKYSFQNLLKMIQNDIIEGNINDTPFWSIIDLINMYAKIAAIEEPVIDINRSITQNKQSLRQLINSKQNEILEYQLKKLNFINGYSNADFVVIIPQSQKDKQEEGKQQHNCVGYFYDENICRGEDFIYFVRKKDNPQRSYVTCRFNKQQNKTVEVRIVNNRSLTDIKAKKFIQEVSDIIKKHKNSL